MMRYSLLAGFELKVPPPPPINEFQSLTWIVFILLIDKLWYNQWTFHHTIKFKWVFNEEKSAENRNEFSWESKVQSQRNVDLSRPDV